MKASYNQGFTLVELGVVLAIVGSILGGIWTVAGSMKERMRQRQAFDAIVILSDSVRAAYMGQSGVLGGTATVVPALVNRQGVPPNLMRSPQTAAACSNTNNYCLDTPWSTVMTDFMNGSLEVCAWVYDPATGDTSCSTGGTAVSQYFGIQFDGLSFGSCMALTQGISTSYPSGLEDIYINGSTMVATGLPPSSTNAGAKCTVDTSTNNTANTVSFVYDLRGSN